MLEIFEQSPFKKAFAACLPERVSHRSVGSTRLGLLLLAGHLRGVECLSDLKIVREDPYLRELFEDEVAAIRTLQDFLYDFTPENVTFLNEFLNKMAKAIHEHLCKQFPDKFSENMVIDIDGSHHVHYGEAIEGLAYNYKSQWCLESHVAFDQYGLCHGIEIRPGNTKPGTGADAFIEQIFQDPRTQRVRNLEGKDFFRGDSAYCNQFVIRKCLSLGVHFTVTANKATTHWDQLLEKEGVDWKPWEYSKQDLDRAKKANHELPDSYVGHFFWEPGWAKEKLVLPIVVKKTFIKFSQLKDKGKKEGQTNFFELDTLKAEGDWEYYAVVTNFDLTKYTLQEIFEHHRKRGNAENFIKEGKYNFSLKNFPCGKLAANNAWAIMAQIAHNLIRWVALLENPDHPSFAKKIRDDFFLIAGKISSGSRQIWMRVSIKAKEVFEKIEGWQFPGFNSARIFSTA